MSRCFPFPPAGYARNGSNSEALIESIKLRKEDEKVNKDSKKEKRREKKERKKERKEKASLYSDAKELKSIELERIRAEKNNGCLQNGDDYENEQLERSDITVEHDQPVSWQEPCCSDSTQSSNKRKRSVSPSSQLTGIKIRFSLKNHRDPGESKSKLDTNSRILVTADSAAQDTNSSRQKLQRVSIAERDQSAEHSDSLHDEKLQSSGHGVAPNWVAPPLTFDGLPSDDQDWLFSSVPKEERHVSKRVQPISGPLQCSSPSLWPRAQYLPEVELYALPYAVPF